MPRSPAPAAAWDEEQLPPADWGRPRAPALGGTLWLFGAAAAVLVAGRRWVAPGISAPALDAWSTIFVAVCVQALPFLVFGVALSAAITAFVPARFWTRVLPRRPGSAVPVAGALGAVLPGCECASVPVAGGLMARGVAPAAALTFLLAAPAVNPVVLAATLVAFPGRPEMAAARFAASLVTAVAAGWAWLLFGKGEWLRVPHRRPAEGAARWTAFRDAMTHDIMHAGGFLVVGALAAATINVLVPPEWVTGVGGSAPASILVLAFLAVLMSICSEADAFVAASLTGFSPTARLVFLVVGPMVDLKLIALQTGFFGRSFAVRFVPLTFVLAVACGTAAGGVLL
jgi:uncharacterized membrane protein YraQ (UPF0718 family)